MAGGRGPAPPGPQPAGDTAGLPEQVTSPTWAHAGQRGGPSPGTGVTATKTEVLGIQVLAPTGQGTPVTAPGLCEGPTDLGRLGKAAPQERLS